MRLILIWPSWGVRLALVQIHYRLAWPASLVEMSPRILVQVRDCALLCKRIPSILLMDYFDRKWCRDIRISTNRIAEAFSRGDKRWYTHVFFRFLDCVGGWLMQEGAHANVLFLKCHRMLLDSCHGKVRRNLCIKTIAIVILGQYVWFAWVEANRLSYTSADWYFVLGPIFS